ncbi:MAG: hypothetical protein A2X52_05270, partial [Candidatus Rokubacteria bacterium GWC2_70_16]
MGARAFVSSLRARLLLLVLLGALPPSGVVLYEAWDHYRLVAARVQQDTLRVATAASSRLAQAIEGAHQLLTGLAALPEVRKRDPSACSALFADLLRRYTTYTNLGAVRPDGDVFCSGVPLARPVNVGDRAYFRGAIDRGAFALGEYEIGRITGKASVYAAFPVTPPQGPVEAVVYAALDLTWVNGTLASMRGTPGSTVTLVDRHGIVLGRHPDPEKWLGKPAPEAPVVRAALRLRSGVAEDRGADGIRRLFGFAPLGHAPEADLFVIVGVPTEEAYAEANRLLVGSLAGLGIMAALAFIATWAFSGRFVLRPVSILLAATRRLESGDLGARTEGPSPRGELGELSRAMDRMAESLERSVSARLEAEQRLRREQEVLYQSEKLAAMGELLAGVAHELNNPLAVIMGRTALLRQALGTGPAAAQAEKIAAAAERCARLVKNFLALARKSPPQRQPVELNRVVQETLELLAYPLRVDSVEVVQALADDLPVIWADPHQLHQVVINLATNAHQAMRETTGPRRLTLATRFDAAQGGVVLEIADTGPGIPSEIRPRIFEPFFTTKPQGQGTGLGLSLCQGIVEGHGGSIRLESRPGQGAVFVVELPPGAPPSVESEAAAVEAPPRIRGKAILVVDDE